MEYSISAQPISSMQFCKKSHLKYLQLLAVGDEEGGLKIIEIPKSFSKKLPNEEQTMSVFFEREVERVKY